MPDWRKVFGFGDDAVNFDAVHARYRDRILGMSDVQDLAGLRLLNAALLEAEAECETTTERPYSADVVYFY